MTKKVDLRDDNGNGGAFEVENNINDQEKFTVAGTNIDEVKRQNAQSGLTFNELNEFFADKSNSDNSNDPSEKTH